MNLVKKVINLYKYFSLTSNNSQHFAFVGKSLDRLDTTTRISYNCSRPNCLKCIHAEENAIKRFLRDNDLYNNISSRKGKKNKKIKVDLLVVRVSENGQLKNSKPCRNCVEMIFGMKRINVDNVYYSNVNGEIVCEKFKNLYNNIEMCKISRGNL